MKETQADTAVAILLDAGYDPRGGVDKVPGYWMGGGPRTSPPSAAG